MRKYNTSTEKIFTVTKFLGLYGDISKENEYKPQFRLRMKVVIPFSSDIKSINKKDEINLNTVSQWKVTTTRSKKIQLNLRNLSIQEACKYRVLCNIFNHWCGQYYESKSMDQCYMHSNVRLTFSLNNNKEIHLQKAITKQRYGNINIFCPSFSYGADGDDKKQDEQQEVKIQLVVDIYTNDN